jgi:hypothetical protein
MLWVIGVLLVAGGKPLFASRNANVFLYGPAFQVGGLKFTVPSKWQGEPAENPSRAGQWRVAPSLGQEGESGEVVVLYFGPGVGGTTKENVESWIGTMFNAEGHPAAAEVKHHETNGLKISQVVIFGAYNQTVFMPGIPPQSKQNYGLLGAVIETPQGNIYWRMTGPESLITANLPLFNKVIDSGKVQDK